MSRPKEVKNYALLPWVKFKQLIYSIYEHRIANAHEINGSANMNYCALNEYVLVYFMDLLRDRDKAEERIVDMFINLRYFYDQ